MADNVQFVKSLYEAFGRGDIDAIVNGCHEDMEWNCAKNALHEAGWPWFKGHYGPEGVRAYFMEYILPKFDFPKFNPITFSGSGDDVFVVIEWEMVNKATGKSYTDTVVHWNRIKDGKMWRHEDFVDTAKVLETLKD